MPLSLLGKKSGKMQAVRVSTMDAELEFELEVSATRFGCVKENGEEEEEDEWAEWGPEGTRWKVKSGRQKFISPSSDSQ